MLARDVMNRPVITVYEHDTLADVTRMLEEHGISGLPVLNRDGQMVGIVTEHDLLDHSQQLQVRVSASALGWISPYSSLEEIARYTQGLATIGNTPVHKVMTRKVLTVQEDECLETVAQIMARRRINRVPVMRKDELVGIITRGELIRAIGKLSEEKPGILSK